MKGVFMKSTLGKNAVWLFAVLVGMQVQAASVRLMTFNYQNSVTFIHELFSKHQEKQERRSIAIDMLEEYKPDVLGFQEPNFGDVVFFDRELSDYCWVGERVSPFFYKDFFLSGGLAFGDYNAIFYNQKTLELLDDGQFWLNETMAEHEPSQWASGVRKHHHVRACTWARFKNKENGKTFYVFNTHLSLDYGVSLEEARLIGNYIKEKITSDELIVFMGDFNVKPYTTAYREVKDRFGFEDAKNIAERVIKQTIGTWGNGRRITLDYVFLKNYAPQAVTLFEVVNFNRNGMYPSDHSPVMIDYNL